MKMKMLSVALVNYNQLTVFDGGETCFNTDSIWRIKFEDAYRDCAGVSQDVSSIEFHNGEVVQVFGEAHAVMDFINSDFRTLDEMKASKHESESEPATGFDALLESVRQTV